MMTVLPVIDTAVLDRITDAVFAMDGEWRFTYLNAAAARRFQRPVDALLGKVIWDELPDAVGTLFYHEYHRAFREQVPVEFDGYYPAYDTWVHQRVYPSPEGLTVVSTDITAQTRETLARLSTETSWRTLMNATPEAALLLAADGTVLAANAAALHRLNTTADVLVGTYGYAALPAAVAVHRKAINDEVIRTGQPISFTEQHGARVLENTVMPVSDPSEGVTILAIFSRDITDATQAKEALRISEARLQAVFANAALGLAVADCQGYLIDTNAAFQRMLGYTGNELRVRRIHDITHPEDLPEDLAHFHELLAGTRESFHLEKRYLRKDGGLRWGQMTVSAIRATDGTPEAITAVVEDITARKQAETERALLLRVLALLNSYRDRHSLMREVCLAVQEWSGCSSIGIRLREGDDYPYFATLGFSQDFVLAETHLCAFDDLGSLVRDRAGSPVLACMCGNILAGRVDPSLPFFTTHGSFWTNSTTRLLASTSEEDRQARTRNRCHGEGYESVALIPLRSGGETLGLLQLNDRQPGRFTAERIAFLEGLADTLAIALSERLAQEVVRQNEERFRLATNAVNSAVYDYDLRTGTVYRSEGMEQLVGIPVEQIPQTAEWWEQRLHPDDHGRVISLITAMIAGSEIHGEAEYRVLHADGHWIDVLDRSFIMRDHDGTPLRIIGATTDITALKEIDRAKDEFLTILSHELLTPLTSMLGFTEHALEQDTLDMYRMTVPIIQRNARRQARLLNELLDMSKLLQGRIDCQPRATDLGQLATAQVEKMQPLAVAKRLILWVQPPSKPLPVFGDPKRLLTCLDHIIGNSIKFTRAGGRITVTCDEQGGQVVLTVTDTGRGIAPRDCPLLFQPFQQVDRDETAGGLGLGLAVVRGVVEWHGGTVQAHSPGTNQGSTFTITLPLLTTDPPQDAVGCSSVCPKER